MASRPGRALSRLLRGDHPTFGRDSREVERSDNRRHNASVIVLFTLVHSSVFRRASGLTGGARGLTAVTPTQ